MEKKPLTDQEVVRAGIVTACRLIAACGDDREDAFSKIGTLSFEAAAALLVSAVDVAGTILRWSDLAAERGGGVNVRELLEHIVKVVEEGPQAMILGRGCR